jgi:RNA polymerase sigma-70 factor (ECF subfamily)
LALATQPPDQRWDRLVQRMAGGDHDALASLYDATCGPVLALVGRIVKDDATAEEGDGRRLRAGLAAGRAVRRLARRRPRLAARDRADARDRPRAVGVVARETREPVERAAHVPCGRPGPEDACAVDQRRRHVRAALAILPREQREAIELAYYDGLSHSEIADRLEQPLGTVKTRIRLAMTKLRDTLSSRRGARMKHQTLGPEQETLAALYALGSLDAAEARDFERHLGRRRLRRLPAPGRRDGRRLRRPRDRAVARRRRRRRCGAASFARSAPMRRPSIAYTSRDDGEWIELKPGLSVKLLRPRSPNDPSRSYFVRLEPGAVLDRHTHRGVEHLLRRVRLGDRRRPPHGSRATTAMRRAAASTSRSRRTKARLLFIVETA